ncbi:ATP-binding protein [Filimonas effusa]|uniref:ATP-binding protein n=1 Tax=Filimonas effusa TaxID=2508721 RepID=A0A4Q1DE50_9BACT|nr:ATP-binding protein [Filimonas effusa]RXK87258.1 ATP-binding protein [Filimonas effusa]
MYSEGGTALPVQVSWDTSNPDTRDRELKGLLKACTYCNVKEGWLLTTEEEEIITLNGIQVTVKPMWKWLLEG